MDHDILGHFRGQRALGWVASTLGMADTHKKKAPTAGDHGLSQNILVSSGRFPWPNMTRSLPGCYNSYIHTYIPLHYMTLHYIHTISFHFITLHYITLHIYYYINYVYVCMYVRMYVCTYVRMYVCTYVRCWIAWVGCVPIWKSNKWWNSFLTCPKFISSFSTTHEFCFSLCILSKHMLKGSKARPKSQSWTLPTDTNWIDWDWDEFPGETSYQKMFFVFGM